MFAGRVREAFRELGAPTLAISARTTHSSDGEASAAVHAVCVLAAEAMALTCALFRTGLTYAAFDLSNAAGWPLRQELMHSRVHALMIAGLASSLLVHRLAEATSLSIALWAAAVPLLLGRRALASQPVRFQRNAERG